MKTTYCAVLSLFLSTTLFAAAIRGTVKDATGAPLGGASVAVDGLRAVTTDDAGAFVVEVPPGAHVVRIAHPGFRSETHRVAADETLDVTLDAAFSESMVVAAIRAESATPVTKSDIGREEIERQYHGQDVPLLMRDAPSITAYAESGAGGAGYSYISLRGLPSSRINFTLDGVPLADSEDMTTYFADFPDLARSLQSIQIQRGVGTSTVGSASFAGSVNLQSIDLGSDELLTATLGGGSFGNRQASVGWQSGALPSGFQLYTRVSYLESEGFRDSSGMRQRNLFVSAAKQVGEGQLKLTGFSGHEDQQLSFYATDLDTLRQNVRANPLQPEEEDSFGYDLAQLQYIRPLDATSDMTASVYYQRGYGWYRLFDSEGTLREYGLDGMLLGSLLTFSKSFGSVNTNYGVHVNRFKRDHTRDAVLEDGGSAARDYANYGVKQEANAFAKATWNRGALHLYGDAQVRYTDFEYHGDVDVEPVSWTFFNPKIGARYDLSARSGVYVSTGLTTREPARNDLFHGEDDATIAHDLHAVRPERVVDFEAGFDYRGAGIELAVNVYAMEFRNEIAATGELSEIGLPLRRNVDRSHRRGLELDASWQVTPSLALRTTANASRNRIDEWTQFYDLYDAGFTWTGSRPVTFRDVEPLLTPGLVVNQTVAWTPSPRLSLAATGRYVAESYLDNTNDAALTAPSYTLLDTKASYAVTPWARLSLQVNNLFDNDEVFASGYSYLYYVDQTRTGTPYYYPQAGRNAVLLLDLTF